MPKLLITLTLLIWSSILLAQEGYVVRVWFTDKSECGYSTDNPQQFLSDKSIARHNIELIKISEQDLPITQHYKQEVMNMAQHIVTYSNWLNTLVVECDSNNIQQIEQLPFVKKVEVLSKAKADSVKFKSNFYSASNIKLHPLYGVSHPISKRANVVTSHKRGRWGEGVYIAVLDAGFGGVDTLGRWFDKDRIKFTCDVVNPQGNIFRENEHGTAVLSTMLANREGEYMGIAPKSDYALIRTEDINVETPCEEDMFVRGLEIADSLGVDIVNVSLGYSDYNGIISVSTLATEIATSKGIVVVTSCGNRGKEGFTLPADAKGVIAVGGVDKRGRVTEFTSREYVRGRYKAPKVCALGSDVPVITGSGKIMITYGTSFAAPAISGAVAIKKSRE
ncbi:MAG: S8 family serine peptidase [Bacteroidales bacterium]|nr:S8 family serine peptidase [Bacteroidales bacterium]